MEDLKKILNPVIFIIVIICFFLPFFNITCQQQKIGSVTGFELITGTNIATDGINKGIKDFTVPEVNKGTKTEEVSSEPLALIALLLAIGGLIISFYGKISDIGSAATGLMGTLVLIFLSSVVREDILGKVRYQPLTVECATGYYLTLIFFIIALVYNAYLFYMRVNYISVDSENLNDKMRICPTCGTVNDKVSMYCNKCGSTMENFQV